MIKEKEIQYRILYDSLSRFSILLNKADSLQDILACLLQNIKYLYNYSLCRFHYFHHGKFVCYTISNQLYAVEISDKNSFSTIENEIFDSCIPYREKTKTESRNFNVDGADETWIWKFNYSPDAGMLIMLISGSNVLFSKEQIPVLKIVSEMLYNKTRLVLLLDDIQQQKEALTVSYKKLEESNHIISQLTSAQEKTIEERTKSLTTANAKLVDIIQFNSHNIREPLTRISGLLNLQTIMPQDEFFSDYWPLLEESVRDMDNTIKQVIFKTETIDIL